MLIRLALIALLSLPGAVAWAKKVAAGCRPRVSIFGRTLP